MKAEFEKNFVEQKRALRSHLGLHLVSLELGVLTSNVTN